MDYPMLTSRKFPDHQGSPGIHGADMWVEQFCREPSDLAPAYQVEDTRKNLIDSSWLMDSHGDRKTVV